MEIEMNTNHDERKARANRWAKKTAKNDKGNTQCTKCNRVFMSTPAGKGNCPDCDSSDVKKMK